MTELDRGDEIAEKIYLNAMKNYRLDVRLSEQQIIDLNQVAINAVLLSNQFMRICNENRENNLKEYRLESAYPVLRFMEP